MFDINTMSRRTRVCILIITLAFFGILLFYLWIITFDLDVGSENLFEKNNNLRQAKADIKNLPSFWAVVKSTSGQVIDLFKGGVNQFTGSATDILITPTAAPIQKQEDSFGKLPISE